MGGSRNSGRRVGGGGGGSVPLVSRPTSPSARTSAAAAAFVSESAPPPPTRRSPDALSPTRPFPLPFTTGSRAQGFPPRRARRRQRRAIHPAGLRPPRRGPNPDGRRRPNLRSVMERNDLDEFLAMAELGDRDFTAERRGAVVVSMGDGSDPNADPSASAEERERERRRARRRERLHRDSLKVPDGPPGGRARRRRGSGPERAAGTSSSGAELWRRGGGRAADADAVREEPRDLAPALARVRAERHRRASRRRARPALLPLPDLEAFVKELDAGRKKTMLLLNKADLLSEELSDAWSELRRERNRVPVVVRESRHGSDGAPRRGNRSSWKPRRSPNAPRASATASTGAART